MRPIRLELKGFTAFRETTVIDFDGVDLFALVGPTGSGKSSIIDGIVFALYGSVARYKKTNLVAPSINQLSTEARVRLDFSVADESYSAVRVVRRTAGGATTKEARLESGDEVLAGNARELDEAVEQLLGLDFNQFTKTVVLPQGDFARFLTESSGDRQSLLRRLLGMEQYRRVGAAARERAKTARAQADALAEQVAGAAAAPEADLKALAARRKKLEKAEAAVLAAVEARLAAQTQLEVAETAAAVIEDEAKLLAAMKVPKDVTTLETDIEKADVAVAKRADALEAEQAAVDALAEAIEALDDPDDLEELAQLHDDHAATSRLVKDLAKALAAASKDVDAAVSAAEVVARSLASAQQVATDARIRAGAAGLIAQLKIGESCPVCTQVVTDLPTHDPAAELDELDAALAEAKSAAETAGIAVTETTRVEATTRTQLDAAESELADSANALKGEPSKAEAKKRLTVVRSQLKKLDRAAAKLDTARRQHAAVVEKRTTLEEVEFTLRHDYLASRDLLASFGPPAPEGTHLVQDWTSLVDFAAATLDERKLAFTESQAEVKASAMEVTTCDRTIERILKPLHDGDPPQDPARWIVTEHSRTQAEEAAMLERRDLLASAQERIGELRSEERVATELGRLVSAKGFEQWLMVDVMDDLARRATARLFDLSGGAYSLVSDAQGSDFAIRDHRNADEVRPARTLSGGETFLASLALALALADSVAELSPEGVPPIESMFLDEGFGTLDPETLDVVASAIEELGAAGRMVGVVTHIRDLADRIPTRYEVSRSPTTSAVTRSEAV